MFYFVLARDFKLFDSRFLNTTCEVKLDSDSVNPSNLPSTKDGYLILGGFNKGHINS